MEIFKSKFLLFVESIIVVLFVALIFLYQHSQSDKKQAPSPTPQVTTSTTQLPSATTQSPAEIPQTKNTTGLPLKIAGGFSIETFSDKLENPRVLIFDRQGFMLISEPAKGSVVYLKESDPSKAPQLLVSGNNRPHGLELNCRSDNDCTLYVADMDAVYTYKYTIENGSPKATEKKKIIDLPPGGNHVTRSLKIYNNKLLISVGSSCNVCNESDERRAAISVSDLDGKNFKVYAKGLRNSVFMAQSPFDNKIWATENGRDLIGDDIPPDEVNIIEENKFYGWPVCYGQNIHDTAFDHNTYIRNPCQVPTEIPAHIDIQAHSASLGLGFVPSSDKYPTDYHNNLIVAFHGSWNRTVKTGYKVERFKLDEKGNKTGQEDFITGWLTGGKVLGRPVDIKFSPATSNLYITDDQGGKLYRVYYK